MDFGRISLTPEIVLYLFGTPGQERFHFMWNELSRGAIGAVILADTRRLGDCFAAIDYFEARHMPFIVAVIVIVPTVDWVIDRAIERQLAEPQDLASASYLGYTGLAPTLTVTETVPVQVTIQ